MVHETIDKVDNTPPDMVKGGLQSLGLTLGTVTEDQDEQRSPFLVALGERVRTLRSRRGMTRKAVAVAADVSERHLANLEYGSGNASILVLLQVARALQCTLAELLGDVTTSTPEWLLIRELLQGRDEATCVGHGCNWWNCSAAAGWMPRGVRPALP